MRKGFCRSKHHHFHARVKVNFPAGKFGLPILCAILAGTDRCGHTCPPARVVCLPSGPPSRERWRRTCHRPERHFFPFPCTKLSAYHPRSGGATDLISASQILRYDLYPSYSLHRGEESHQSDPLTFASQAYDTFHTPRRRKNLTDKILFTRLRRMSGHGSSRPLHWSKVKTANLDFCSHSASHRRATDSERTISLLSYHIISCIAIIKYCENIHI